LKGKKITSFSPVTTQIETLNLETYHDRSTAEFDLHPKDPDWILEIRQELQLVKQQLTEQATVNTEMKQRMDAFTELQAKLTATEEQLARCQEELTAYKRRYDSQPSPPGINTQDVDMELDTTLFPPLPTKGTEASRYAHPYTPTGNATQQPKDSYAKMAEKLRGQPVKKKATTSRQKAAIARIFDAPAILTDDSKPLFEYLYFNNKYRTKISSLRSDLRKLGIDTGRIIDIHYPSRGVIAMLMHVDYIPTLTTILHKYNKAPLENYDPFSASHITSAEHHSLSEEKKSNLSKQFQQTRMTRALTHMRPQIRNTVAKAFTLHGWLSESQIQAALNSTTSDPSTQQSTNNDFLKGFGDEPTNTDAATSPTAPKPTPIDVDSDIAIDEAN
jgi:cell division septation protein DedD